MAAKFKNIQDFTKDELSNLKNKVFSISDAYYGLKELQKTVNNPDLNRLIDDLKNVVDSSLGYYTRVL